MSNLEQMPFFKISSEFSCNHEFISFEEKVGYYWNDLEAARTAIKQWAVNNHFLFNEHDWRKIKSLNVWFSEGNWPSGDVAEEPGKAVYIVAEATVSEQKHLGYDYSDKTIVGPDGEEYSRRVKVDKGHKWTDYDVRLIFEIERLTLKVSK